MYRLEREEFVKVPYLSLWATLGFQAGFINAFGFLAVGRYVSHVTGYGTQVGTQAAVKDFLFALELFGSPLFFIAGSFFSGFFTAARLENGERPRFDIPMACFSILLGALFVCGESGLIGEFGTKSRTVELVVLYLLSFVCGLQNGCFSVLTKGQIRTTHMTGISTDIGTDLSRIVFGNLGSEEKRLTNGVNRSRILTFLAFTGGSVISVLLTQKAGYFSLIVPLLTSLAVFASVLAIGFGLDKRFGVNSNSLVGKKSLT